MYFIKNFSVLSESAIIEYMNSLPSFLLDKSFLLYRGIDYHFIENAYIYYPSEINRVSKTKKEYGDAYNLLFDNLPNWLLYPKRSKSIIMTTSKYTAEIYGTCYNVFPKLNSKIAFCSQSEILYSFIGSMMKIGLAGKDLLVFNMIIKELIWWLKENDSTDYNYEYLIESLNSIPKNIKVPNFLSFETQAFLNSFYKSNRNLIDTLQDVFDPIANGFQIVEYNENLKKINFSFEKEAWTESDCVLIKSTILEKYMSGLL